MSASERFWRRTVVCGSCLLWTGTTYRTGYGHLIVNHRNLAAHRYAWELTYGIIPNGLCVLHRCDERLCVNPEHLFLGTKKDNMIDMVDKGRNVAYSGSANGNSKLSRQNIVYIRSNPKETTIELARMLNVSDQTIRNIKYYRTRLDG